MYYRRRSRAAPRGGERGRLLLVTTRPHAASLEDVRRSRWCAAVLAAAARVLYRAASWRQLQHVGRFFCRRSRSELAIRRRQRRAVAWWLLATAAPRRSGGRGNGETSGRGCAFLRVADVCSRQYKHSNNALRHGAAGGARAAGRRPPTTGGTGEEGGGGGGRRARQQLAKLRRQELKPSRCVV